MIIVITVKINIRIVRIWYESSHIRHCSTAHPRSKLFYTSEFQYSDFDVFNGLLIGITSLDQKPDKFQNTLIQQL